MTREDALNKTIGILTYHQVNFCKSKEAVANMNEIIEALEKIEQEPCDDAISRQAVIDAIEDDNRNGHYSCFATNNDAQCFKDVIRELPSVTVQPKMGKWKAFTHSAYHGNDEDGEPIWREVTVYHCNLCNRRTVIKEKYCPKCGCKMQEVKE